ncbi:hypothetical protein ACO0LL_27695 [Undibacterium sp. TC4M20W]|uniref:hypothetical protein n=1 Tax=Undibacterium sp. TC4M20W TaxID=3413052 RepID=UPI003BF07364
MTNTILELHTTAILPSHRIWSLFGDVDWHDKSDTEDISCDAAFGPIEVKIRRPWWKSEKPDDHGRWNTAISFHCEKSWNDVRMIYALEQCFNLYDDIGGYYLAKEDRGDLGFIVEEDKLILPEQYRDYFSTFPMPFDRITYSIPPQFSPR